jgi:hypothetical protein
MVHDQMFCLIAPPRLQDPTQLSRLTDRLQALFAGDGRIHFASMALLPPNPDDADQQAASLMLEFAIDPQLKPESLIADLLKRDSQTLFELFEGYWNDADVTESTDRQRWLVDFLDRHTDPAAGGFVGARDRSVEQIKAEARLFTTARKALPELKTLLGSKTLDGNGLSSTSLAAMLATWAKGLPSYPSVAGLAPRSYWRSTGMSQATRAIRMALRLWPLGLLAAMTLVQLFAAVGVAVFALLAQLLGADFIQAVAAHFSADLWRAMQEWSNYVIATTLLMLVLGVMTLVLVRSAAVGLALTIMFATIAVAISAFSTVFNVFLLMRLLGLLTLGLLGVSSLVIAALTLTLVVVLPLLIAVLAIPRYLGLCTLLFAAAALAACAIVALHAVGGSTLDWAAAHGCQSCADLRRPVLPGLYVVDVVVVVQTMLWPLLALLFLSLRPGTRLTSTLLHRLEAPRAAPPLQRGQQVHPSVQACETALHGKINHLLSLTDIRRPYALHRSMLIFWLKVVTLIGHGWFVDGRLGHATGIAFAHWHIVDRGRRLLFCANYSGSFGGYLEEFIAGGSQGANLFWRWTHLLPRAAAAPDHPAVDLAREFPPTRLWVFEGCKHAQWFKAFARDSMLPHLLRFEAYNLTYQDIDRSTRLRDAIAQPRNPVDDDRIMRALES